VIAKGDGQDLDGVEVIAQGTDAVSAAEICSSSRRCSRDRMASSAVNGRPPLRTVQDAQDDDLVVDDGIGHQVWRAGDD